MQVSLRSPSENKYYGHGKALNPVLLLLLILIKIIFSTYLAVLCLEYFANIYRLIFTQLLQCRQEITVKNSAAEREKEERKGSYLQ